MHRSRPLLAVALLAAVACTDAPPTASVASSLDHVGHAAAVQGRGALGPDVLAALAEVRRATARYHDIEAAMADGYTVWSPNPYAPDATCSSSAEGQMGYHLLNPSLRGSAADPAAGDAELDPLRPEMLLYEKRADGKLHLVGVEYLVFTAAWEAAHGAGAAAPEVLGQTVPASLHTFPGGGPAPIPHYELHVWLWSGNPNGMFSHWNPTVSC